MSTLGKVRNVSSKGIERRVLRSALRGALSTSIVAHVSEFAVSRCQLPLPMLRSFFLTDPPPDPSP
jgi:hypothetical protein